ncbi:aphid transmission protein [Silene caulimovirus A]|nr:aphid transmission protein [Silene caulimovirus A]
MNQPTTYPHIYKKEQILELKPLSKLTNDRKFFFSSLKGTLPGIISHCNNINEILGRCFLGIAKLNSFFGLAKDPSEKLSKNDSVYNLAKTIFSEGGSNRDHNKHLEKLLEKLLQDQVILSKKIDELQTQVKEMSEKIEPEPLTKEDIKKNYDILQKIENGLKGIIGIE